MPASRSSRQSRRSACDAARSPAATSRVRAAVAPVAPLIRHQAACSSSNVIHRCRARSRNADPSSIAIAVSSAVSGRAVSAIPRAAERSTSATSRRRTRTPGRGRRTTARGTVIPTAGGGVSSIRCHHAAAGPDTSDDGPAHNQLARHLAANPYRCPPARSTPGNGADHRPAATHRRTVRAETPQATACATVTTPSCSRSTRSSSIPGPCAGAPRSSSIPGPCTGASRPTPEPARPYATANSDHGSGSGPAVRGRPGSRSVITRGAVVRRRGSATSRGSARPPSSRSATGSSACSTVPGASWPTVVRSTCAGRDSGLSSGPATETVPGPAGR